MGRLDGKVALISGGARGQGATEAKFFVREGAKVIFGDILDEAGKQVEAEIRAAGGEATYVHLDVTNENSWRAAVDTAVRLYGKLNILVNNAAIFSPTPLADTSEAQWDAILDTNLKAQFFCAQRAATLLKKSGRGRIINFASLGGLKAWPKYTAYSVSKAGVIMLTRCLARALAPAVTVNAIAPGTISFPEDAPEIADRAIRGAPLRRTGSAEDITNAVVYLIGAGFVTGQVLVVDGGSSIPS